MGSQDDEAREKAWRVLNLYAEAAADDEHWLWDFGGPALADETRFLARYVLEVTGGLEPSA